MVQSETTANKKVSIVKKLKNLVHMVSVQFQ